MKPSEASILAILILISPALVDRTSSILVLVWILTFFAQLWLGK
jgi:hypothetical protein